MISFKERKNNILHKIICLFVAVTFVFTMLVPPQARAQGILLPNPGVMVPPSAGYLPVMVKGITVHPENPLEFDFIINNGETGAEGEELKKESKKLVKYFLASLTVPEKDLWVNLSPYEKDRVIPDSFGLTEMGRDLLAQDYILKQLTSTMMYPEDELGEAFWGRVYEKALEKFGTTDIPLDTFNKIWIVPEKATIYQKGNSAYVVENKLKVMLEADYVAMQHVLKGENSGSNIETFSTKANQSSIVDFQSSIIKDVLIPAITKEVNEGKNFASLRQMANSIVLASWYKQNLKESLLGQVYVDQAKTKGIEHNVIARSNATRQSDEIASQKTLAKTSPEEIYDQYLEAFNTGVYNYIKEEYDSETQQIIPRKYFSGGVTPQYFQNSNTKVIYGDKAMTSEEAVLAMDGTEAHSGTSDSEITVVLAEQGKGSDGRAEEITQAMADNIMLKDATAKVRAIKLTSEEPSGRDEMETPSLENVVFGDAIAKARAVISAPEIKKEKNIIVPRDVLFGSAEEKAAFIVSETREDLAMAALTQDEVNLLEQAENKITSILEQRNKARKITGKMFKMSMENVVPGLRRFTEDPEILRLAPEIREANLQAIRDERWDDIIQAYYRHVPFGTAGIREQAALMLKELEMLRDMGPNAPILKGTNTINNFTLLEKTAGLIIHMKETGKTKIMIGFDSRVGGKAMANMLARQFIAASDAEHEFKIFLFDEASPFPELTYGITIDQIKADFGILISASHNPSNYNGYKVVRSNSAQLNQEAKDLVVDAVSRVDLANIKLVDSLAEANEGQLTWLGGDTRLDDEEYYGFDLFDMHTEHIEQVKRFLLDRDMIKRVGDSVNIGFAAFNGSGNKAIPRLLKETGFTNFKVVKALNGLNGMFPAFGWGEQPDPGDPIAAGIAIKEFIDEHGQEAFDQLDVLFGTDPDADRMGVVVKVPENQQKHLGKYTLLSANDAWTLLLWYRLMKKTELGMMNYPSKHVIGSTHVTTDAIEAVGNLFDVKSVGRMMDKSGKEERGHHLNGKRTWVGFTYLGDEVFETMEAAGITVEIGAEESNGMSLGGHVKDKDGTMATILLAEVAAYAKEKGTNIVELLDDIYREIGHYGTANKPLPRTGAFKGAAGITEKLNILKETQKWAKEANKKAGSVEPFMIAGKKVIGALEFKSGRIDDEHYKGVPDEGVRFFFEDEINMQQGDDFTQSKNYVTIRPSGTSQTLRFYVQNHIHVGEARSAKIAKLKADNYRESERIALETQKQILQDVGLDKYFAMVDKQKANLFVGHINKGIEDLISMTIQSVPAKTVVGLLKKYLEKVQAEENTISGSPVYSAVKNIIETGVDQRNQAGTRLGNTGLDALNPGHVRMLIDSLEPEEDRAMSADEKQIRSELEDVEARINLMQGIVKLSEEDRRHIELLGTMRNMLKKDLEAIQRDSDESTKTDKAMTGAEYRTIESFEKSLNVAVGLLLDVAETDGFETIKVSINGEPIADSRGISEWHISAESMQEQSPESLQNDWLKEEHRYTYEAILAAARGTFIEGKVITGKVVGNELKLVAKDSADDAMQITLPGAILLLGAGGIALMSAILAFPLFTDQFSSQHVKNVQGAVSEKERMRGLRLLREGNLLGKVDLVEVLRNVKLQDYYYYQAFAIEAIQALEEIRPEEAIKRARILLKDKDKNKIGKKLAGQIFDTLEEVDLLMKDADASVDDIEEMKEAIVNEVVESRSIFREDLMRSWELIIRYGATVAQIDKFIEKVMSKGKSLEILPALVGVSTATSLKSLLSIGKSILSVSLAAEHIKEKKLLAEALGNFEIPESLDMLLTLALDKDLEVRSVAEESYSGMSGESFNLMGKAIEAIQKIAVARIKEGINEGQYLLITDTNKEDAAILIRRSGNLYARYSFAPRSLNSVEEEESVVVEESFARKKVSDSVAISTAAELIVKITGMQIGEDSDSTIDQIKNYLIRSNFDFGKWFVLAAYLNKDSAKDDLMAAISVIKTQDNAMTAAQIRSKFLSRFRIREDEEGATERKFWLEKAEDKRLSEIIDVYLNGEEVSNPEIEAISLDRSKMLNVLTFLDQLATTADDVEIDAAMVGFADSLSKLLNSMIKDGVINKIEEAAEFQKGIELAFRIDPETTLEKAIQTVQLRIDSLSERYIRRKQGDITVTENLDALQRYRSAAIKLKRRLEGFLARFTNVEGSMFLSRSLNGEQRKVAGIVALIARMQWFENRDIALTAQKTNVSGTPFQVITKNVIDVKFKYGKIIITFFGEEGEIKEIEVRGRTRAEIFHDFSSEMLEHKPGLSLESTLQLIATEEMIEASNAVETVQLLAEFYERPGVANGMISEADLFVVTRIIDDLSSISTKEAANALGEIREYIIAKELIPEGGLLEGRYRPIEMINDSISRIRERLKERERKVITPVKLMPEPVDNSDFIVDDAMAGIVESFIGVGAILGLTVLASYAISRLSMRKRLSLLRNYLLRGDEASRLSALKLLDEEGPDSKVDLFEQLKSVEKTDLLLYQSFSAEAIDYLSTRNPDKVFEFIKRILVVSSKLMISEELAGSIFRACDNIETILSGQDQIFEEDARKDTLALLAMTDRWYPEDYNKVIDVLEKLGAKEDIINKVKHKQSIWDEGNNKEILNVLKSIKASDVRIGEFVHMLMSGKKTELIDDAMTVTQLVTLMGGILREHDGNGSRELIKVEETKDKILLKSKKKIVTPGRYAEYFVEKEEKTIRDLFSEIAEILEEHFDLTEESRASRETIGQVIELGQGAETFTDSS